MCFVFGGMGREGTGGSLRGRCLRGECCVFRDVGGDVDVDVDIDVGIDSVRWCTFSMGLTTE